MKTFAEIKNTKTSRTDMSFYAVACWAEKTSWPPTVVAMIGARIAFILGFSFAFSISDKRLFADSAGVVLQNEKCVKSGFVHPGAPLAQRRVMRSEFDRIAFNFGPNPFASFDPESFVIRFAFSDVFWGVVAGAAAFFSLVSAVFGLPLLAYFLPVFVVVLVHPSAVRSPLFRGAIGLPHG